jgi:hypothetical protein
MGISWLFKKAREGKSGIQRQQGHLLGNRPLARIVYVPSYNPNEFRQEEKSHRGGLEISQYLRRHQLPTIVEEDTSPELFAPAIFEPTQFDETLNLESYSVFSSPPTLKEKVSPS